MTHLVATVALAALGWRAGDFVLQLILSPCVSKIPVIHWTGLAVRLLHIQQGDAGITLDHHQGAVREQGLHSEHIADRPQAGDRECVPGDWLKGRARCLNRCGCGYLQVAPDDFFRQVRFTPRVETLSNHSG